jgi:hypothetical protein
VIRHYHKSPNEPFLSFTPGMGDQIERSARCENRFPLRGAGGHENNRWPIPRVNRREVQRSLSHWQGASMIPILGVGAIRFGGPRFRAASVLQVGTVARKRDPPNTDLRCGAIWFSRAEVREGLATPVGARPADLGVGEYQSRGSATRRIPILGVGQFGSVAPKSEKDSRLLSGRDPPIWAWENTSRAEARPSEYRFKVWGNSFWSRGSATRRIPILGVRQFVLVARKRDPPNTNFGCGAIWFSRAEARPSEYRFKVWGNSFWSRGSATLRAASPLSSAAGN